MIYLDNAATSWPKPQEVYDTLCNFLQDAGANPGRSSHRMASTAARRIAEARAHIARLINAETPDRIVFTSNATDSLNLAILGLLRPGHRVVTSSMEHNSIRRPLKVMRGHGVEVLPVRAKSSGVVDPADVARALGGAHMVAITQASNVNGAIQPIAEIAERTRRSGAKLLVDGAQTVGAMPVDVRAMGIDLLAFPGHKALFGPPGTGVLYVGLRVDLEEFQPLRTGGTGVNSEDDLPPSGLPHRYEAGTLNTLGIAGLLSGVQYVEGIGIHTIERQHFSLTTRLIDGLTAINGVHVYAASANARAAVVSFSIDGWEPAEAGAVLDQSFDIACRTGLHCAPDACATIGAGPNGTIRFSPGWFTTADEIDAAVSAVAEIAGAPLS
jgi:cysteine desulfurase/selenocysteine lyase